MYELFYQVENTEERWYLRPANAFRNVRLRRTNDRCIQTERNPTKSETSTGFFPDLIEKRIEENLEPLDAQIFALTQMTDKLVQGNSAREYPTASTRELRFPSDYPLTDGPGISRTLPLAPLRTAEYSPNISPNSASLTLVLTVFQKPQIVCFFSKIIHNHLHKSTRY